MREFIRDESDLNDILEQIKELSGDNCIVLLRGNLASGKTTLVKEFVKSLGIEECVTSPTFSILQNYGDKIFHYDIYNKGLTEFLSLGLLENLDIDGIHFVEWADDKFERMLEDFMFDYIVVEIESIEQKRKYTIRGSNEV